MATWGQRRITTSSRPECTLYYHYNTTVDAYHLKYEGQEDFGLGYEDTSCEFRFDRYLGEAMMEALIHHVMAFDCSGDKERFVKRYIDENRFNNAEVVDGKTKS